MKEIKHFIFDWQGVLEIRGKINKEIFTWIRENKISASVLTNCPGVEDSLFLTISHPGNIKKIKPNEEAFLIHLRKINFKPEEVVFIDDNPINTDAARRVGLESLRYINNEIFFKEIENEFRYSSPNNRS